MPNSTSLSVNQPKTISRLDQILSSRPATDHDLQPSPTPSVIHSTPQKRRNQQAHLISNHFTPSKSTRSRATTRTPNKLISKPTPPSSSSSAKKQKQIKSQPSSNKKSNATKKHAKYSVQAEEEEEKDELNSDSEPLQGEEESLDLLLPATPSSSASASSSSTFNLMELLEAGKVQESPRRGRRVGKVNMGWISPSTQLQRGDELDELIDLGGDDEKGNGKGREISNRFNNKNGSRALSSAKRIASTNTTPTQHSRKPSWRAPSISPSRRQEIDHSSTPSPPPTSSHKFNPATANSHGATLVDSQGWAAARVLGKGERVPYLGSPAEDGMVGMIGLGIDQSDDRFTFSQSSFQSQELFNDSSEQVKNFQLPTKLQPSYNLLSGFSFNTKESGSPAPVCLQPQEAGRGQGLGTKLVPFEVCGIGRMALHEELTFNFNFLEENADHSNGSASFHRYSDAEGSTSSSGRTSGGSSASTNPTSIGTPGSGGSSSSAPHSGPSPSFSLCSHFPASEPRTPMNAGVKTVPSQETTHQALAAVLNFGTQESTKQASAINSLKLKNPPSTQTIQKLQEVRDLVLRSRENNKKRKLSAAGSVFDEEASANKRPSHSLHFIGLDTAHVPLSLPSLAWPDSDASSHWSPTVNSSRAEKESIMRWLEIKPSNAKSSPSEYEIDAEQRAELEENQLQWSQHPMLAKALRDRARREESRRVMELQMAREQRARDRAYGRASARSHAKKAGTHYPKVQRAARASVRQRARKELKAHPDALDGISASRHRHKPSGAYLIQPPAPVYDPSPEPQAATPSSKGKKAQKVSLKTKGGKSKKDFNKGQKELPEDPSSSDAVFGCSCGRGDDDDDTPPMVQCDSCNKWHHLPCIGVESEDQLDAEWYCDECCNPQGGDDANSVATDPLDLELEYRSPASEASFNVLSTPKTQSSTPRRISSGSRLAEPVFAQPSESPVRSIRQPLVASALALAPSPPMMSSSRYRGPPAQESQNHPHFSHTPLYSSSGYHPHAHQAHPQDEKYGRGRVRAERIGGWLNMESKEAQDSDRRRDEEEMEESGSPLARKSTPAKRGGGDLFLSQSQDLSSRGVSTSLQPISRPRTPTTPRANKEVQGLRSPAMGLSTPSRHAHFEKRTSHQFSDDEDHQSHRRDQDDVFSTPSRLAGGSASWGYGRGANGGSSSRAGSRTPGKASLPSLGRGDPFAENGAAHQRRDSSQWGLPSALRTPSRDIISRNTGSFTPSLGDHSGGYSVGLPSLVFSSGGLDMESHPPSYSNHASGSVEYHPSSSASRAWQLQSPTSTTRAGVARARQSSASWAHSLGLGTPGGMVRTPELQPTFNRASGGNNSSIRGTAHSPGKKSFSHQIRRERERSRSPSPIKRSRNVSSERSLPSLKKLTDRSKRRRNGRDSDSDDDEARSNHPPTSSSPFPPTPTFEGQVRRLESSMDDSKIPTSARKLANLAHHEGVHSTPLTKSYSQPSLPFTRTPPSEESNRLALSALLDSPADLMSQNRKRNSSGFSNKSGGTGLGIGLALDDVLDWS